MKYQKALLYFVVVVALVSCGPAQKAPQVEGNYTYEHAFNYDMDGNHFDVHETGTMDFYADSTALDSARQVYTVTLADGDTVTWVYNYISPSRWRVEGDTLFFVGVKEGFRMEVIEEHTPSPLRGTPPNLGGEQRELVQKIIDAYSGGIDYEYKFHIDTLTAEKLQWSFTYRDGHSDTWTLLRVKN